jgi:hypothetical protein
MYIIHLVTPLSNDPEFKAQMVTPLSKESEYKEFLGDSIGSRMASLASNPCTSSIKTTWFVEDLVSLQDFRKWIDMFSNDKWNEDIRSALFSYLDSCNIFSQEDKFDCLEKLIMELEIEQENLLVQRKSHDFLCQDICFEDPFDQQQEEYE